MNHERILHIYECLCRCTDSSKGVSVRDIQRYLSESVGMENVSDLTIRRDLERLTAMGNDVQKEHGAHNTTYYRLAKRFSFNEIRFIVNSVSINKFLPYSQKIKLIKKFEGMCSESEVRKLIARTSADVKNTPWDLMSNLETVYNIIENRRKIDFEYGKFNTQKQMIYYHKRRNMFPVKVIYFSGRFYLKCFDIENKIFRTYRIDRMKNITGNEKSELFQKLPEYNGAVVDIFEPEYFESVTLRVRRFLTDDMLEWLGSYANIRDDFEDDDYIIVRANIGISQGFYRWVMKYGCNMEIISPLEVRENFLSELKKVTEIYEKK